MPLNAYPNFPLSTWVKLWLSIFMILLNSQFDQAHVSVTAVIHGLVESWFAKLMIRVNCCNLKYIQTHDPVTAGYIHDFAWLVNSQCDWAHDCCNPWTGGVMACSAHDLCIAKTHDSVTAQLMNGWSVRWLNKCANLLTVVSRDVVNSWFGYYAFVHCWNLYVCKLMIQLVRNLWTVDLDSVKLMNNLANGVSRDVYSNHSATVFIYR